MKGTATVTTAEAKVNTGQLAMENRNHIQCAPTATTSTFVDCAPLASTEKSPLKIYQPRRLSFTEF